MFIRLGKIIISISAFTLLVLLTIKEFLVFPNIDYYSLLYIVIFMVILLFVLFPEVLEFNAWGLSFKKKDLEKYPKIKIKNKELKNDATTKEPPKNN